MQHVHELIDPIRPWRRATIAVVDSGIDPSRTADFGNRLLAQVNMASPQRSSGDGKVWTQNNGFAGVHRLDIVGRQDRDRLHRRRLYQRRACPRAPWLVSLRVSSGGERRG